jgi:hypothetical protein
VQEEDQWTSPATPPKKFINYFIIGKKDTGKSTFACELIKSRMKDFNQLVVIAPHANYDDAVKGLLVYMRDYNINHPDNPKACRVYLKFNKSAQHKDFMKHMEDSREQGLHTLVFIDDPVGNNTFTKAVNSDSMFNGFTANLKHWMSALIYCTQVYGGMSPTARANMEVLIFFPDTQQRKNMLGMCNFLTKDELDQLMRRYASKLYNAIWINNHGGGLGVFHMTPDRRLTRIQRSDLQ